MHLVTTLITTAIALVTATGAAYAATPNLSLSTNTTTPTVGQIITIDVAVTDIADLTGYQVTLAYDPQVLSFNQVIDTQTTLGSTGRNTSQLGPQVDTQAGTLTFGAFSFGDQPGFTGSSNLATISFNTLTVTPTELALTQVSLVSSDSQEVPTSISKPLLINPDTIDPIPTPSPTTTPSPSPTPSTAPVPTTLTLDGPTQARTGQSFTISLGILTDVPISGADVILLFDPRLAEATQIIDDGTFSNTPVSTFNNGSGKIQLSFTTNPADTSPTGNIDLATIIFKAKNTGTFILSPDMTDASTTDTNVIDAATGQDILTVATSHNVDITQSRRINFKNFQRFPSLKIASSSSSPGVEIKPSEVYQSILDLFSANIPNIFAKANGYLTKKFLLNDTDTTIDLSTLTPGDLNQDNIINTIDLSLLYQRWFTDDTGDFNGDQIINSLDHWYILQNYLKEGE